MKGLIACYRARFATSEARARQALGSLPDGVSSDSRILEPFPIYVERAEGPSKWTIEGHRLVDLWAGHGALLFGHRPPVVEAAITTQVARGTHFGACHPLEVAWAERVCRLIPSAERVRFTNSGTEAVLLALHLARAATGKRRIIRFTGHYHGWHPSINVGSGEATHGGWAPDADEVHVLPIAQPELLAPLLVSGHDVAAVILEPTGPCSGVVPLPVDHLRAIRALTAEAGVALIFDEIVTGFRMAPGGAQALTGVTPDLTTLAKVLSGGLPGGALAGRADLLALLSKRRPSTHLRIAHLGTYNGNPISAAAGVATLDALADGEVHRAVDALAAALRQRLNRLFAEQALDWAAYGEGSCVKFIVGHQEPVLATAFDAHMARPELLLSRGNAKVWTSLRLALLVEGVDASLSSFLTAAHEPDDLDAIESSFARAITRLRADGIVPPSGSSPASFAAHG